MITSPAEKTDWVNEPLHLPRPWLDLANEIARAGTSCRAYILRRAIRLGLPLVARQEELGEKWVRATLAQAPVAVALGRRPSSPANERTNRAADTETPAGHPRRRESSGRKKEAGQRPPAQSSRPKAARTDRTARTAGSARTDRNGR